MEQALRRLQGTGPVLTVKAWAKVNLTLEVLGKREDGYHQVASVMQTIDLWDELRFAPSDRLLLRCNVASLETPDNLALRAATLLREHTGFAQGAEIHLEKAIPLASGLGGGSSDAAAALKALNRLWSLGLSPEELRVLAADLGSDVPFFLRGGTAQVEGRGEEVCPLPPLSQVYFVLLVPPLEIPRKTATLYGHMTPERYTDGSASLRLRRSIEEGKRLDGKLLFNAFQEVAFSLFPILEEHRQALLESGAEWVRLTGTGPALYTFAASRMAALDMAERLRSAGYEPYVASTVEPPKKMPP
ncbi:MAG: 4-(cytidine 5'-diphospho)-2-C-methyl-D-erythritol kinase [Chloroflexi bacterium]|nr:4-(cytidine 5'-diphospho)-2-C-methyl-D-erythritol kinase [Chloroflexota bacterium]